MKKTIYLLFILLVSFCTLPLTADAVSLGVASDFNTFVFKTFLGNSVTEGRLAVGGDAYLDHYTVGDMLSPRELSANDDVLVVGGDLLVTSGRVYYGDILVEGTATMPSYQVADGSLVEGATLPFDFTTEEDYLKDLSFDLAGETANGTYEYKHTTLALTGDGTSKQQIFNINGFDLMTAANLAINGIPKDATIVINVSGVVAGIGQVNLEALFLYRNKVLFNFHNAFRLNLSGAGIHGSVLAPRANVVALRGNINGTLIAESFDGGFRQNHVPFTGDLPGEDPALVPEPGTMVLLGCGLLGLVVRFRKQKTP